jgi:hypothetical protein
LLSQPVVLAGGTAPRGGMHFTRSTAPTMPIGTVEKAPLKVMEELSVTFNSQALKGNGEALDYRLYFSGLGV